MRPFGTNFMTNKRAGRQMHPAMKRYASGLRTTAITQGSIEEA